MTGERAKMTPDALLAAARAGDKQAIARLLEAEQSRIYSFGLKMCHNREDASDVLQETMLAVARSIGEFRGDAALPTWLFQIARSFCIKKRRLRKGAPKTTEALDDAEPSALADPAPSPEQLTRSKELEAMLNAALATLPAASREVLVLRDVEGLTAPEVAEVLAISVDAVKSKLHRARAALQKALAPRLQAERTPPAKHDCPDILASYSQKLEGQLTGAMCAQMETHVAHCAHCSAACDALKKSLSLCKTRTVVPAQVRRDVQRALAQVLSTR